MLFVYLMFVVRFSFVICFLFAVRCLFFAVSRLLFVVCCLVFFACWLFVVLLLPRRLQNICRWLGPLSCG